MMEDLRRMLGPEWRWLRGLSVSDRLRVAWFVASLPPVMGCAGGPPWAAAVLAANLCLAARALRKVDMEGLEE